MTVAAPRIFGPTARAFLFALVVAMDGLPCTAETADTDSTHRSRSWVERIKNYLNQPERSGTQKAFDVGLLGGPHYSSDVGAGLGVAASATYRRPGADTLQQRSNASLYANMTVKGYFSLGLKGHHLFSSRGDRLEYAVKGSTFPGHFWGIGHASANDDAHQSTFRRNELRVEARLLFRPADKVYVGPYLRYSLVHAANPDSLARALLGDKRRDERNVGVGVSFVYDTRDALLNATSGGTVRMDHWLAPFAGKVFGQSDLTLSAYRRLWTGGVLAAEAHGVFSYGDVPWTMLAEVGSSNRMRGYYEGRYRDKHLVEAQVEWRQRVWKKHGVAVWVGAANVFSDREPWCWRSTLPNAGVGYRFFFKEGFCARLDCGFTRNGRGFVVQVNEAF